MKKAKQEKESREMSVSHSLTINREAAEKAIAAAFPQMRIDSSDVKWETGGRFVFSAILFDRQLVREVACPKLVKRVRVSVFWPEGEGGHGIIEFIPYEKNATSNEPMISKFPKFACWKNERGEVEILKWSEPPHSLFENLRNWDKYGVRSPRNEKASATLLIPLVAMFMFITVNPVLLFIEDIVAIENKVALFSILVTFTVFSFVTGFFIGHLMSSLFSEARFSLWNNEKEKRQADESNKEEIDKKEKESE